MEKFSDDVTLFGKGISVTPPAAAPIPSQISEGLRESFIVIHPTPLTAYKRWPLANWVQLIESLPNEYQVVLSGELEQYYEIDPKNSWIVAAAQKNIPIVVPGWEDSTTGNIFASYVIKNELKASTVKNGIEYMIYLTEWYRANSGGKGVGFFQIGGGIAGDFPICVVPMMYQDLEWHDVPFWSYFCQISDSTTSYGSYSGAVPNEKITWGKLDIHTPKFIVESDATIVAPLIFAYILGQ